MVVTVRLLSSTHAVIIFFLVIPIIISVTVIIQLLLMRELKFHSDGTYYDIWHRTFDHARNSTLAVYSSFC